ncbi:hypothetical protein GOP47_0005421 [Adiantum capillus-veneris]|uniref:Uncharacterized protein n=1 Tax=Adiantum capillus-veneris TaxID=13818 RepID=A0A9D4ZN79_ADICA|nr:hypothetical protein GOP47_0005421 [Adiantum capillus-veneris]
MRRAIPAPTGEGPRADVYFEFNFFDGVMVDCKEVNNAEWGPWQSRLNQSSKVWDVSGLEESYDLKNLGTKRELRESNVLNMENRCDWKKEQQASPKRGGKSNESLYPASGMRPSNICNNSLSPSKDPAIKKRVQFLNGENDFSWKQQLVFPSSSEHQAVSRVSMGSSAATDNSHQLGFGDPEQISPNKVYVEGHSLTNQLHASGSKSCFGDSTMRDPVSLSTGHLDWLWCEEAERQDTHAIIQGEPCALALSSCRPSGGITSSNLMEKENEFGLPVPICPDDSMPRVSSWHNWKALASDPGKSASGGWATFSGGDSARCSSMSLTDLVETSPGTNPRDLIRGERATLASHLQLAGSSLASQFCAKEADMDCLWPFSPAHSSLSTSSTSKREASGSKAEPKRLSISDPNPCGNLHGILHCTIREGLPNYTFLLDDYDEVVTAKIWIEDVVLGEQQGAWRYTFYSLKGDSKKKGRSGWKHWRKKEKLTSELVGTMRVSSLLCTEQGLKGEENLSVESEFVLLSARAHDPSLQAHVDLLSQASSSSLETGSHGCSKTASHTVVNASSSPSQSRASSSDGGHSDVSSPGAISAWYVAQSLIPSSLGSPDTAADGRQKARKWSLHSGISGMRISKAKRRSQQSNNMSAPSSNVSMEDLCSEATCGLYQSHAELAAMIINVPLELQERLAGPMPAAMSDAILYKESQPEHRVGDYQTSVVASAEHEAHVAVHHINRTRHKSRGQHRQASITVILPSGNHGRPLSDMRGPSPLIKRWKEGGKCDCKGWDLGCGLLVLNNEHTTEGSDCSLTKSREYQAHSKPLTLYRQDGAEQEEAYISLAPQENGLIAVDFRAPLSPLQAFAMAVATLHGRGSSVPDLDTPHDITTTVMSLETQSPDKKTANYVHKVAQQDAGISSPGYRTSIEGKKMDGHMHSARQGDDSLGGVHVKAHGNEVFGCSSELALSFERV